MLELSAGHIVEIIIADLIVGSLLLPGIRALVKRYKAVRSAKAFEDRIAFYRNFGHTDEMETISRMVSWFLNAIYTFAAASIFAAQILIWFFAALAQATVASTAQALGHPLTPTHYSQMPAVLNVYGAIVGLLSGVSVSFLISASLEALKLSKTWRVKAIERLDKELKKLSPEGERPKSFGATQ